jgi:hypothetical protein
MNFSGVMPLPTGKIIDHSDKILWHIEGDGTAYERRLSESKFGDVLYKRPEFGTVASLDVIEDCCGPLAHDAP